MSYSLNLKVRDYECDMQGIVILVVRAELDERKSLQAGDGFQVTVKAARPTPVRLVFGQSILLDQDAPPILKARIICTAVNAAGRPYFPEQLADLIDG